MLIVSLPPVHQEDLLKEIITHPSVGAVRFRGDDCCELKKVVDGNKLYVDPLPKAPVGRGQSVNILSEKLEVEGGLLPLDHEYIDVAVQNGVFNFMLSFVEGWNNILELEDALGKHCSKSTICLKIESQAGLDFVFQNDASLLKGYRLMAARDDLMIQIGILNMIKSLNMIVNKDPNAICASRLLIGLESGSVSMADVSDLEYMLSLGYKDFMFSDAIKFWKEWNNSL